MDERRAPGGLAVVVLLVSTVAAAALYSLRPEVLAGFSGSLIRLVRVGCVLGALFVLFERLRPMQIFVKILLGLLLGASAGLIAGAEIAEMKPVGTAFIRLIQMIVVPLVFASLLVGTASLGDPRKMGRIGLKTLVYYLTYTAFAVVLGLGLANSFEPGRGLPEEVQARLLASYSGDAGGRLASAEGRGGVAETLLGIIPTNPMEALSRAAMLQVIVFAIFSGIALALVPRPKAAPVLGFFEGLNDAMIKIVHIVIALAPYGVFALIAAVVGSFGAEVLASLLRYCLITIAGMIVLNFTYPPVVRLFSGMSPMTFMRGIRAPQLIAFSTSSSSATLPVTIQACQDKLGVPRDIASFVLPLGATVNMNGSALYHGVSAVFIAQVYGMPLGVSDQLMIVLTATLASIGAAGAPGVAVLMLVIVLKQAGIPLEGISLILGVERILDMFRTTINITGDASAAVVIAASEGVLGPPVSASSSNAVSAAVSARDS